MFSPSDRVAAKPFGKLQATPTIPSNPAKPQAAKRLQQPRETVATKTGGKNGDAFLDFILFAVLAALIATFGFAVAVVILFAIAQVAWLLVAIVAPDRFRNELAQS